MRNYLCALTVGALGCFLGNGALAASATVREVTECVPMVHRLPLTFDPRERFLSAGNLRLPYTPASALPQAPSFERPEGSFAVRLLFFLFFFFLDPD